MKKTLILFLFALSIYAMHAQTVVGKSYEKTPGKIFVVRKDSLQENGCFEASIRENLKNMNDNELSVIFYRLAVSHTLLNHIDSAFYYLHHFLNVSPDDRVVIVDKDFDLLRNDSLQWERVIKKIEDSFIACLARGVDKELALQLFYMGIEDQKYRVYFPALCQVDLDSNGGYQILYTENNINALEEIIKKHGFPTISMVGNLGSKNAFLILQHSMKIKKYYKDVKKIYLQGGISGTDFAMLTDRHLSDIGRKQLYGTQFVKNLRTHMKYPGKYVLYPVKDFANVNERRKKIGFKTTVEEYRNHWNSDLYIIPEKYYKKK